MRRFIIILLLLFAIFQMVTTLTLLGFSLYVLVSAAMMNSFHFTSLLGAVCLVISLLALFVIVNSVLIFLAIKRRSELILKVSASFLTLIVILKLLVGSLYMSRSYMMKPHIKDFLNDAVYDRKAFMNHNAVRPMDIVQEMFHCCGNTDHDDYWVIIKDLPKSCCQAMNNCDNKVNEYKAEHKKTGCAEPIYENMFERPNLWLVIGLLLSILLDTVASAACMTMRFRNNRIQNQNFNDINMLNGNLLG